MGFFPSFTYMLLHSLWQSAIILTVYAALNLLIKNIHPLQKRNILYILISAQIMVSIVTFVLCLINNSFTTVSHRAIHTLLTSLPGFSVWEKYADMIVYSYLLIVLFRALIISNQCRNFQINCTKDLVKPSAQLKVFADLKACQLGIKKKVILRYSRYINSPLTFGVLKPFILLPFSLVNRLSSAEAESIILHELSHIKNHDYLLNWIVIFAENIYFFNPFFKIITAKLKAEREKNCDVQVLDFNYSPMLYAEALLKTAKLRNSVYSYQLAAVGKKTELLQRIHFFSKKENLIFNKNNSKDFVFLSIVFFLLANVLILPVFNNKETGSKELNFVSTRGVKETTKKIKENVLPLSPDQKKTFFVNNKKVNRNAASFKLQAPQEEISIPAETEFIPIPVNYNQTPDSTKEFIYNEETQEGKIIRSFKLVLVNGDWVMQPQWMILETKPDSSRKIFTDTLHQRSISL